MAGRVEGHTLSIAFSPVFSVLPACLGLTILHNHPIDDLSTQDASPPREMVIRTVESFIDHNATTTMAFHTQLLN
jgi:hypothetical protein